MTAQATNDAFLELRGVYKGFGPTDRRTQVLTDVNLSMKKGEFVAIVGYSGAGKSTLVSLVAGLLRPDRGQVLMDGKPVTGPGPERGIIFQSYSLLPWLSAFDNVLLAVDQVFPTWSAAQRRERAGWRVRPRPSCATTRRSSRSYGRGCASTTVTTQCRRPLATGGAALTPGTAGCARAASPSRSTRTRWSPPPRSSPRSTGKCGFQYHPILLPPGWSLPRFLR